MSILYPHMWRCSSPVAGDKQWVSVQRGIKLLPQLWTHGGCHCGTRHRGGPWQGEDGLATLGSELWIRIHWIRIRIQHFKWIRIRDFMTKNWRRKKYSWKFFKYFFDKKIAIYLYLGLHKGRPSYRKSLQPSKQNIQHLKKWNLLTFFLFLWIIFRFWIGILIQIADPDKDPGNPWNPDPILFSLVDRQVRKIWVPVWYLMTIYRWTFSFRSHCDTTTFLNFSTSSNIKILFHFSVTLF